MDWPSLALADEGLLQLREIDRRMAIQRARDRRQRIFKAGRTIEQHHAIIFRHAALGEASCLYAA